MSKPIGFPSGWERVAAYIWSPAPEVRDEDRVADIQNSLAISRFMPVRVPSCTLQFDWRVEA